MHEGMQRSEGACNAPELSGTSLGGVMPVGTASTQPKQALMSALGAMERALPETVQTITQTAHSTTHVDMRGRAASIATESTGTPLGGMMPEGNASLQPKEAPKGALGARDDPPAKGGKAPVQALQGGHTHGSEIDRLIRGSVPSEDELASRYIDTAK